MKINPVGDILIYVERHNETDRHFFATVNVPKNKESIITEY
jgi:hypothetical protein